MTEQELRESIVDEEHLRLLSLGYLVAAIINGLFSVFGLFYTFVGLMMGSIFANMPPQPGHDAPPPFIGWFFGGFGLAIFVISVALGVLKLIASRRLKQRQSRVFCMVVAALSCFSIPYGTVLGVFTFLVLGRPSVVRLFSAETQQP